MVVAADGSLLSSGGALPSSITVALPRGTRVDAASRPQLCTSGQAARGTCPAASSIGFGRYVVGVTGFLLPGGQTDLTWWIDAFLGTPARRGDLASVVLSARLLGADGVPALLAPALGTTVPATGTATGRLVRRASGAFGIELAFAQLPVALHVAAPIVATPSRLELSLTAVRRTRQNFVHHIRVRTPSGYQVRTIKDHRLVGHELLRTPPTCRSSWPYELRVGFPDGTQRTAGRMPCLPPISGATSAARRRAGSSRR